MLPHVVDATARLRAAGALGMCCVCVRVCVCVCVWGGGCWCWSNATASHDGPFSQPPPLPYAQRILQEARGVLGLLRGPIVAQLQGGLQDEWSTLLAAGPHTITSAQVPQQSEITPRASSLAAGDCKQNPADVIMSCDTPPGSDPLHAMGRGAGLQKRHSSCFFTAGNSRTGISRAPRRSISVLQQPTASAPVLDPLIASLQDRLRIAQSQSMGCCLVMNRCVVWSLNFRTLYPAAHCSLCTCPVLFMVYLLCVHGTSPV